MNGETGEGGEGSFGNKAGGRPAGAAGGLPCENRHDMPRHAMVPEAGHCFMHFKALMMKTHAARGVAHEARTDGPLTKNPS